MSLSKYIMLVGFISQLTLFANDDILSPNYKKDIDLSIKKINIDGSKQKIDWINPIRVSYEKDSLNSLDDIETTTISINQPIFKSGGIYNVIKYSNSFKQYQTIDTTIRKKLLIKDATILLYQLKIIDINLNKQRLLIKNSQIDTKQKQEQVINGILDVSFLNDSIIKLNQNRLQLSNLNIQKQNLLNKFVNLTSQDYKLFKLPKLSLKNEQKLLDSNIYIQKSKLDVESKKYMKNMVLSKYLPEVSLTYNYNKNHNTNIDNTNSGIRVSIPLDIKSYYDTQSSKISYLKSKLNSNIVKEQEKNYLKYQIKQIFIIDNKLKIQSDTIDYYNKLLKQMRALKKNGLKTKDDLEILNNSKDIAKLDLEVFKLDKQIKLLEIYARTN